MGVFDRLKDAFTGSSDSSVPADSSGQSSTDRRLMQIDAVDSVRPDEPTEIPDGVDVRFHIKGQLSESDEIKFNDWISKLTLSIYFGNIRVQYKTVGERYPNPRDTPTKDTGVRIDKLPPDDSLVRIHAPECLRVVPEGQVNEFYNEVRESYTSSIVNRFEEMGYNAQSIEMLIVQRLM